MPIRRALLAAIAAALIAATGCQTTSTPAPDPPSPTPPTPTAPTAPTARDVDAAWADLGRLPIRAEDTGAHYHRPDWGDWYPVGHGCDTRRQVLREQGTNVTVTAGCRLTGTWVSPYDSKTITNTADLQIDHRVPLKEATRSGARHWIREQREFFYNDLVNLVAVTTTTNATKGDKDPGRWRPPHRGHWCAYATAYITTKHAWHLAVDQPEHDALTAMLHTCPGHPSTRPA